MGFPQTPRDVFGDRTVSCRAAGAYTRHNCIFSTVEEFVKDSGFVTGREFPAVERPGDMKGVSWQDGRSARRGGGEERVPSAGSQTTVLGRARLEALTQQDSFSNECVSGRSLG